MTEPERKRVSLRIVSSMCPIDTQSYWEEEA